MSRRPAALLLALCAALALGACGRSDDDTRFIEPADVNAPETPAKENPSVEIPSAATKNTTRLPGPDPASIAADAALAVYPAATAATRPGAVALVDQRDWRTALAASALMGPPLGAPMLLTDPGELPGVSADALKTLAPTGAKEARGAQVIRVGTTPRPGNLRPTDITAASPAATAAAIDSFLTSTRGTPSRRVVVVSADDPAFSMPAAAWAAKSGDPILFVGRTAVPGPTTTALRSRNNPKIYLLGPTAAISAQVEKTLKNLGDVTRIDGPTPVENAIAFARFSDDDFGWGVTDPGHGLVFTRTDTPLNAGAASPVSAAGTFGPLLLLETPGTMPAPVREYLLDIQPGYEEDPVRGVYNHAWIAGDDAAVSAGLQAQIDDLLEISPVQKGAQGTSTTPGQTQTATTPQATTATTPTATTTSTQLSTTPPTTTTTP